MPTTVEVLADAFKRSGTPFIVGHPGGETVELMEAARERDMRFILMKQESAGAMLAATWGEITGSPGVSVSTRGPGATNMVNGVTYASLDRAPLIAITDQYPADVMATGLRQVVDQRQLYSGITKWSTTVTASAVPRQIQRAIRTAKSPTPGAVHLDLPSNETRAEAPGFAEGVDSTEAQSIHQVQCPAELIKRVNSSRRPILLAGLGTLWDDAAATLTGFAEKLGAPVLTTSKCKGVIAEDHPLRAGCIIGGLIERKLVEQSDLIITVGLDPVELQPKAWPYAIPVVSLSNTPATEAMIPATIEASGNVDSLLEELCTQCTGGQNWGEAAAASFRTDVAAALDTPSKGLSPQRCMEIARQTLPRNTIATCDAGASRLLVVQKWEAYGPREFLTSNGLGTMGYAIPGALAARLAFSDRPVVAFSGDGGFMMALAELQTAKRENLPITVVVFDDEEIALIRVKQEIKGLDRYGVGIGGMYWEQLAAGFGINCAVAHTENELVDGLKDALTRSNESTLVVARIDGSGYVDQFNALREL